jgi:purine-binding chemotaxis protein CheW
MNADVKPAAAGIDWQAVRKRLDRADAAVEEAFNPSPAHAKAIMDARARRLAPMAEASRPPGANVGVVLFGLGRERYAIETRFVREVVRFADFTPVPGTPEFVVGVANLRGTVIAIVDLHQFFNIPRKGVTDLSRVIVLGIDRVEFGILADLADGQTEIAAADILPPPGKMAGIASSYVRGVTREALIILDGMALLADERLTVDQTQQRRSS